MVVYEVKDKVVFITGGAAGIGAWTVKKFLKEEAKHVTFLDLAEDAGIALETELKKIYGLKKVRFLKCDVTNDDELFKAYDDVIKEYGCIDIVVNNAGILNDSREMYKKSIEVNVTSLITSTLKALDLMRKDEGGPGGTILNICSETALMQMPYIPIYSATKSAVLQFTSCIGMEVHYSRTGVRIVAVCYGATETDLIAPTNVKTFDKATQEEMAKIQSSSENTYYVQRPENAAESLIQLYKIAESGSSWFVGKDKPPVDITNTVKEAYGILSKIINS